MRVLQAPPLAGCLGGWWWWLWKLLLRRRRGIGCEAAMPAPQMSAAAILLVIPSLLPLVHAVFAHQRPWTNPWSPPASRAAALIAHMTPKEKLVLLQGASGDGIGNTAAIPRLGIPAIHLEDGPNGVADWVTEVTTWPSSMAMAASWDTALMQKYGAACGSEQRGKGMQVMLGPGVNLARVPVGGRNFEYLGEDPVLAGRMAAAEVRGIQGEGVVACTKHWSDNNQEGPHHNGRLITSSVVSDRANFEMYYAPFEAAIKAGSGSVMCSCALLLSPRHAPQEWLTPIPPLTQSLGRPPTHWLPACNHRQSNQRYLQLRERTYADDAPEITPELQWLGGQ